MYFFSHHWVFIIYNKYMKKKKKTILCDINSLFTLQKKHQDNVILFQIYPYIIKYSCSTCFFFFIGVDYHKCKATCVDLFVYNTVFCEVQVLCRLQLTFAIVETCALLNQPGWCSGGIVWTVMSGVLLLPVNSVAPRTFPEIKRERERE